MNLRSKIKTLFKKVASASSYTVMRCNWLHKLRPWALVPLSASNGNEGDMSTSTNLAGNSKANYRCSKVCCDWIFRPVGSTEQPGLQVRPSIPRRLEAMHGNGTKKTFRASMTTLSQ